MSDFYPKREHKRYPLTVEIVCNHEDFVGFDLSGNLSLGGAFIATEAPAPVGTILELSFHLPDDDQSIHVKGEVRWSGRISNNPDEDPALGMGLKFLDLDPVDEQSIRAFFDDHAPDKSDKQ